MTTFDLSPLFRSSVGFDRLANLLEDSVRWTDTGNAYPPYNIEKTGEHDYRITLAVAGFGENDVTVTVKESTLLVEGQKQDAENGVSYLYRGIAGRSFKRQFQLAEHLQVTAASMQNGLLTIDLHREVPEAMKPRQIPISTAEPDAGTTGKLLEGDRNAA